MAIDRARGAAPLVLLAAAAACSPTAAKTAGVSLAVSPTPMDVKTVSVFVIEIDKSLSVASATTAADNADFDFEVPAETPLDFRALARTDKPGPTAIGAMPAYFGTSIHTIALGSQKEMVGLTVHRAGALTLEARFGPGVSDSDLEVALEEESTVGPRSISFLASDLPESFVLRAGRYHLRLTAQDSGMRVLVGRNGLYVGPETESIALLDVQTATGALDPSAARALALTLLDEHGTPLSPSDVVRTASAADRMVGLRIEAFDGNRRSVSDPSAEVQVSLSADPASSSPGKTNAALGGLPATFGGLLFRGTGRFQLRASARLADGRTILGRLDGNALRAGEDASLPRRVVLRVEDPGALAAGTQLDLALLDARGLYAQHGSGAVDLSESDPWAYFPDGLGGAISPSMRGHVERRIARPSGPRGIPVVVRATFTSTAIASVLTATLALPRLDLP